MIRPRYALTLARTKLRSKRGMLIASIVVASILFAALIACIIVFSGADKSAAQFVKAAGNDKYLVEVELNIPSSVFLDGEDLSPSDIKAITDFQVQYYTNLKATYKKAGVPYDATQEMPALQPDAYKSKNLPEDQRVSINFQSPVISAFRTERMNNYIELPQNSYASLKTIGAKYDASGYYKEYSASFPALPLTHMIIDGKEDLSKTELKSDGPTTYGYLVHAAYNSSYQYDGDTLLNRYLLTHDTSKLKGVPVVITAQEAAELFGKKAGIGSEPKDTNAQRTWFEAIQQKLNGQTYQTCTRNATEQTMLNKIQQDYADTQNNKNDKTYIPPALQYNYPDSPCGDITVKSDSRTVAQKAADSSMVDNEKKLGTYMPPMHQLTTFEVVGFTYAKQQSMPSASLSAYVQNLLSPPQNTSTSAQIPLELYNSLPESLKFSNNINQGGESRYNAVETDAYSAHVLEFPTIGKARAFLSNEACSSMDSSCSKKYKADPYGSNYLILDEITKLFQKIISIALPILLGLAFVIMWFTISRIMSENRKETAVYRAMGANRGDITAIYITYVLLVALITSVVSFALGIAVAYVANITYGAQLTDTALTSFGITTGSLRFSLFDLSSPLLLGVLGMVFIVSLLASIQPLIRNVLRPPIIDMREE